MQYQNMMKKGTQSTKRSEREGLRNLNKMRSSGAAWLIQLREKKSTKDSVCYSECLQEVLHPMQFLKLLGSSAKDSTSCKKERVVKSSKQSSKTKRKRRNKKLGNLLIIVACF